ncbi:MAG: hypothetical protein ACOCYT_03880 [Chloroflexota bacterium]
MTDDNALHGPERQERLAAFENRVSKFIKVLLQSRNVEKRIAAARWLGESGAPNAIYGLRSVYQQEIKKGRKANKPLLDSVTYALGQFKALDESILREPGESVEDALERMENAPVYDLLMNIAVRGDMGKRKPIAPAMLNRVAMVLAFSLVILGVLNVAVRGGGDPPTPDEQQAQNPLPTNTASPVADSTETPQPEPATETPVPPTPTETPIPPEVVIPYVRDLTSAVNTITEPRGPLDLLRQYWQDAAVAGQTDGCSQTPPTIPDDVFVDPTLLNEVAGMREAQSQVNTALGLLRQGWSLFRDTCANDTLAETAQIGQTIVQTTDDAVRNARELLQPLQQLR